MTRTIRGRLSPSSPQHCPASVPIRLVKLDLVWPRFLPPPSPPLAGGGEGGCLCSGPSPPTTVSATLLARTLFSMPPQPSHPLPGPLALLEGPTQAFPVHLHHALSHSS